MEVNSATATSIAQLVNGQQPQPKTQAPTTQTSPVTPSPSAPGQPKAQPNQNPESAVVKLSDRAQQLNRAEQNVDTKRAEIRPQEIAEPPGIRFMEDTKTASGKIDTYA